tara:strand:+ start:614 stop:808 length:195 start_codon:yes stop_codon:yes gene_type:complete
MKNKNKIELYEKIDVYYKWFMNDCSSPYDELEWLIKTLLESKHKEDMMQVLNDTYELYNENYTN